jgi:NAD(P)-dependent dehydrogenase (short-subunit alcohol dehydrogenase family)
VGELRHTGAERASYEAPGIAPSAFRLDGKTAVVTGASRNIGAAIAGSFAGAGANVVLVARGDEQLNRTVAQIGRATELTRVHGVAGDVAREDVRHRICDESVAVFGGVDILVNNAHDAGLERPMTVLGADAETWRRVFDVNLFAALSLTRQLAPGMVQSGRGGAVINVVSGAGLVPGSGQGYLPQPTMAPYGVTKAALWMLTRYLAAELAPHVRVNALCPGLTTEGGTVPDNDDERGLSWRLAGVPMGRVAHPSEIAGGAVYLASDAASYTTGEILICNGGRLW